MDDFSWKKKVVFLPPHSSDGFSKFPPQSTPPLSLSRSHTPHRKTHTLSLSLSLDPPLHSKPTHKFHNGPRIFPLLLEFDLELEICSLLVFEAIQICRRDRRSFWPVGSVGSPDRIPSEMALSGMRGLSVFISDIRNCQNKDQERLRVDKELGNIRTRFKNEKVFPLNFVFLSLCLLVFQ